MVREQHRQKIAAGLRSPLERAMPVDRSLEETRAVIFPDVHCGQGNAADDYRQRRATYHHALGHYLEEGHSRVVLGDA